jgi:hypothetical protein
MQYAHFIVNWKISPIPPPSPPETNRTQIHCKDGGGILSKVGVISPPTRKYLHQKPRRSTLKFTKVEVVEMVEIFTVYLVRISF